VASLASFPSMMQRGRKREGLRECRAVWLIGVSVRRYRELETGGASPTREEWRRMIDVFSWPRAFGRSEL